MKIRQAIRAYAAELAERAVKPLLGLPALVSVLASIASIALLFRLGANDAALSQAVGRYAEVVAFATIFALWFSVNSIACIWFTKNRIATEGRWVGNKFVFNSPLSIYSNELSAKVESEVERFTVTCAPPNTIVHMTLSTLNNSGRLQAIVQSPHAILKNWRNIIANRDWPTFETGDFEISAQCSDKQSLFLDWHIDPESLPVILRVTVHAFEVQPDDAVGGLERYSLRVCQPTNGVDFTLQKPISQ